MLMKGRHSSNDVYICVYLMSVTDEWEAPWWLGIPSVWSCRW